MRIARLAFIAGGLLSSPISLLARQDAQDPVKAAAASPEASQVVERLQKHYAGVKGASVRIVMKMTTKMQGETNEMEHALTLEAARPNRAAVRATGAEEGQFALVSDGKTMWQYFGSGIEMYEEKPAPESFAGVLKAMSMGMDDEKGGLDNWMAPHAIAVTLLEDQRLDKLLKSAKAVKLVGREDLGGKPHDHIHITTQHSAADLWVAAEGEAWLVKVVPDLSVAMANMPEEFKAQMPRTEIEFKDWKSSEEFPAETFAFKPPAGAKKVDSLMKAMQEQFQGGGEEMGSGGAHQELLGKQAPDVELELLDGGKMSLASHRGKDVVVLDFWATWCPPCVEGLPVVSKAAADLKDKGVVFYAVNQREKTETIQKFLDKRELKFPVPLDKNGAAGKSFKVAGIPQTVLIGRDGTVQAIHVGFDPSMEEGLVEELKKLADNKPLVKAEDKPKDEKAKEAGDEKPKSDGK